MKGVSAKGILDLWSLIHSMYNESLTLKTRAIKTREKLDEVRERMSKIITLVGEILKTTQSISCWMLRGEFFIYRHYIVVHFLVCRYD